jgi:beta-galactosidase
LATRRISLTFDGVFRDAQFWLNGFYLGRNESGYMGVTWDVTDYVDYHHPNVLVVRVDATQYEGWFYEGAGIYRHVWLNKTDPVHVAGHSLFVHSVPAGKGAAVTVEAEIVNADFSPLGNTRSGETGRVQPSRKQRIFADLVLTDREGREIARSETELTARKQLASQKLTHTFRLDQVRRWDLADPYLYRARLVVREEGEEIDRLSVRFGIREVRFDADSGFFLNGRNFKLLGVNCHQDHAGVGAALPDYLQYYRIGLLKEMGVNAYRASHNAPTPELLDACDSLGMLVIDEQRLVNSSPEYLDQFKRLIERDRNHPSVILWSIGNEEGYIQTNSFGKRIAQTLIDFQHKHDPSRTCTYAADLPDWFPGINEVIPVRGFNYRQFAVADYHKSHPDQPIVGTEMGSTVTTRGIYEKDTIRCYLPDQDITAPWWASTAETWWKLCAEQPWFMGGFIWTGLDYRGEPTPFAWPNVNSHFGIMDMCGFPKNLYYYYQSWWTDKDVLHISPHWNWKGKEGQLMKVWVNSNADEVELFLNGKSFGKKVMPRNGHLTWDVPFEPGKLEAVARKNGRRLVSSVETTGDPVRLVLKESKKNLMNNGQDAVVVNVAAVDQQGREVPDAANLIRFRVTGGARINGVGNGDPSCHEPDQCEDGQWQRSLFSGKCQVIMQSVWTGGPVKLVAESKGLQPAEVVFEAK